jgi:iron complex outermembrane receptor protein
MYGTEVLASYLITRRLFFTGDLSYVRGTRDIVPEMGILTSNIPEMPPLRSRTSLRYDTGRYLAEVEGVFAGPQDNVDPTLGEQPTPGYGIANLRAGANFKRMTLRVGLNNIFGRNYYEHLSYQRDPFRSGVRVYEPGRNLFVNFSYQY